MRSLPLIAWLTLACTADAPLAAPASEAPPPAPAPAAEPALITDEECLARGGHVVTEETYAYLDRRHDPDAPRQHFRICRVDSPKNGAACSGEADCQGGRCWCTGALSRPNPGDLPELRALDGQPATGVCSDRPIPSGEWRCLVEGGKANIHGIIVD